MYYLPEPPFFLVIAGLFIAVTSGLAFEGVLKEKSRQWSKNPGDEKGYQLVGWALQLPFFGIAVGVCIFLAAGLEVFSINRWFAYAIALLITLFTCAFIWDQLGKLLKMIQQGGSAALDLDYFT